MDAEFLFRVNKTKNCKYGYRGKSEIYIEKTEKIAELKLSNGSLFPLEIRKIDKEYKNYKKKNLLI